MNKQDFMRYNLVTSFVCVQCGNKLALSYNTPKSGDYETQKNDGITGAGKVEQRVAIHPCEKCYGEAIRPLEAIRDALAVMNRNTAKSESGQGGVV